MGDERAPASEKKPSRHIALLLGLFGPWGTGQFYLGQTKRAVLWLVARAAFVTLGAYGLHWCGGRVGYGLAFGVFLAGVVGSWLGSLGDVYLVPAVRLRRARGFKVFAYWVVGVVFTVAVHLPIRAFVLEAFKVPSISMLPALVAGDHIMADKVALNSRKPKRGEAIIFKSPEQPEQDFVKRVIAVAGDTLEVKHGHPWLNGWEVPHCLVGEATMPDSEGHDSSGELHVEFLDGEAYLTFFDEHAGLDETQGPYAVAVNEVWVLGDNRNNSHDSRFWFDGRGGGLPLDHVKARALFRWLSFTQAGTIDWSRFGTALAEPLLPTAMTALQREVDRCLAQRPPREKTVPPAR